MTQTNKLLLKPHREIQFQILTFLSFFFHNHFSLNNNINYIVTKKLSLENLAQRLEFQITNLNERKEKVNSHAGRE